MEEKVKQLHTNVNGMDKKSSGEELIKREGIKDSPFEIITIEGESFGAMGGFRITEKFKTKAKVKKELSEITWNRIIQVYMILNEVEVKNKQLNKK